MSTAYYSPPDCRDHDMGRGHPECPQRLDAIADHLLSTGLDVALDRREAPLVALSDVELAHTTGYVTEMKDLLEQVAESGERRAVDPDTVACPGTWNAVLRAAGAAVAATDAVIDGEVENAFCAVRPPGHHATRDQAMGFCFFNNIAIAARHALDVRGLERVAIVDFDVHHGNGTEEIFEGDPSVLMASTFQHPFYPYSGTEMPASNMINVPLAAGAGSKQLQAAVLEHWLPALDDFRPELVIFSAGFDAHVEDDMAMLQFKDADYRWVTEQVKAVADRHAKGRIVSMLEGGYALSALGRSVVQHLRVLAGLNA
jgi:acetoin utilization deacetylase AcuC-like enzyme